jgi:hypothetical protein
LVPIAFHVDYWDDSGWPDRYALPIAAKRQRAHTRGGGLSGVYTPALVRNGSEWRRAFARAAEPLAPGPVVGRLSLQIDARRVEARFVPAVAAPEAAVLHLALLGFDLESKVRAGENRGRTLQHDFVLLTYQQTRMRRDGGAFEARLTRPEHPGRVPRTALVAWLSEPDSATPLQAVGGWLDPPR